MESSPGLPVKIAANDPLRKFDDPFDKVLGTCRFHLQSSRTEHCNDKDDCRWNENHHHVGQVKWYSAKVYYRRLMIQSIHLSSPRIIFSIKQKLNLSLSQNMRLLAQKSYQSDGNTQDSRGWWEWQRWRKWSVLTSRRWKNLHPFRPFLLTFWQIETYSINWKNWQLTRESGH